jgi:hypothetical protein
LPFNEDGYWHLHRSFDGVPSTAQPSQPQALLGD